VPLECATRKVQENQEVLKLNGTQHFFCHDNDDDDDDDDFNILCQNGYSIHKNK